MFQSAPLTDVRGDTLPSFRQPAIDGVSIRSPHGCKGRFSPPASSRRPSAFQSAPLTDVRGDFCSAHGR